MSYKLEYGTSMKIFHDVIIVVTNLNEYIHIALEWTCEIFTLNINQAERSESLYTLLWLHICAMQMTHTRKKKTNSPVDAKIQRVSEIDTSVTNHETCKWIFLMKRRHLSQSHEHFGKPSAKWRPFSWLRYISMYHTTNKDSPLVAWHPWIASNVTFIYELSGS